MKLTWMAPAVIFFSINVFADCQPPYQGSSKFSDAAGTIKRYLGQTLSSGSTASGGGYRLTFSDLGNQLFVTATSGGQSVYKGVAFVCSTSGQVRALAGSHTLDIQKGGGGGLSVTFDGFQTVAFSAISGGSGNADVQLAKGANNEH